ncbi:hypothetical protein [Acidovorax sp. SUPP2825]|uniref:hypothetical protein n=1 Tax=Acidovorax sp. SUPP2825 TaxID=2920879 RepID=UPI0023DE2C1D|nr:hypothetical protein [Acidovorax sp. SUPP2825]GKS97680.1 hypothetical protein AVAK2825_24115 [Acidovorax sp. SUPP2825]
MRFLSFAVVLAAVALVGCASHLKVAPVDPQTGLLKSEIGTVGNATTVIAKDISLSKFNGIAVMSNGGEYGLQQLRATNVFKEVLSFEDIQKLIVTKGLQDQVSSIAEPIGLTRLAKAYKPFLWVHAKSLRKPGEHQPYLQLIATDPTTLDQIFLAEVKLDIAWAGVNDQNVRYPLFNSFIQWARKNP